MQTQRQSWKSLQQYNVVSFVLSTHLAFVFGLGLIGTTLHTDVQGARAQTVVTCAKNDRTHIVVDGDRLASIAAYYGLTERQVMKHNHIAVTNSIYINQRICIPGNTSSESARVVFRSYRLAARPAAPVALAKTGAGVKVELRERPVSKTGDDEQFLGVDDALSRVPPGFAAPQPMAVSSGFRNVFPFGQCTWWAAQRYYQLHHVVVPWTHNANAGQWVDRAREFGWRVSSVPTVGSIFVLQGDVQHASSVGHVGVVEQIRNDGTVIASSMNWGGHPGLVSNHLVFPGSGVAFVSQQ